MNALVSRVTRTSAPTSAQTPNCPLEVLEPNAHGASERSEHTCAMCGVARGSVSGSWQLFSERRVAPDHPYETINLAFQRWASGSTVDLHDPQREVI
ncbi:hypothetical protein E2C01_040966 [Portunus trituberculatus]|uniref:Uncharacterized protein n=1 Tax=Portunus trituberculatus TaxID=210409 RepID=A0A5B7FP44_PORTR|nr:hypothetical protein [Portunus trituberculatus]